MAQAQRAINRADVERAAAARQQLSRLLHPQRQPRSPLPIPKPQAGMRRAIAAAMARSNREIPHYYLQTRMDMSRALRWLGPRTSDGRSRSGSCPPCSC